MIRRFLPHAKALLVACVALGCALMIVGALRRGARVGGGPVPSADALFGGSDVAVEIATREMTRVFSLRTRPPEGGESIGITLDGRFHLVSLDLGPTRSRILCLIEPGARAAHRQLVHFELAGPAPTLELAASVAREGLKKASVFDVDWEWSAKLDPQGASSA